MTTRLAYTILTEIDYDKLEFDPDEPEPLPDGMCQLPVIKEVLYVLDGHLAEIYAPQEVFTSSNTFICYDRHDPNVRVGPDFYFAYGVDAQEIEDRKMYLPFEAGKPPDFVLEVASPSTMRRDMTTKREIYAEIGVAEYWRFDRSGGEYYGTPLAGERLVRGSYEPIELTREPDGVLKGYSPALRLSLCWLDGMLKFYNHETGAYLRSLNESKEALLTERTARQEAESALMDERAVRRAAEARIRRLEEELQRRPPGS